MTRTLMNYKQAYPFDALSMPYDDEDVTVNDDSHQPFASRRPRSRSVCLKICIPATVLIFIIGSGWFIHSTEACLPGWFNEPPSSMSLEGSTEMPTSMENDSMIQGSGFDDSGLELQKSTDSFDSEENFDIYGPAAPILRDEKLEETRKLLQNELCGDWCEAGGECVIDVDPHTYKLISRHCNCPPDRFGIRCQTPYVRQVFEPVKGANLNVEKPSVPVIFFLIILLMMAVGLVRYTYLKCSRRHEYGYTPSSTLTEHHHLRRSALSGSALSDGSMRRGPARTPFSPSPKMYYRLTDYWSPGQPIMKPCSNLSAPYSSICQLKQLTILSRSDISANSSAPVNLTNGSSNISSNTILMTHKDCEISTLSEPSRVLMETANSATVVTASDSISALSIATACEEAQDAQQKEKD